MARLEWLDRPLAQEALDVSGARSEPLLARIEPSSTHRLCLQELVPSQLPRGGGRARLGWRGRRWVCLGTACVPVTWWAHCRADEGGRRAGRRAAHLPPKIDHACSAYSERAGDRCLHVASRRDFYTPGGAPVSQPTSTARTTTPHSRTAAAAAASSSGCCLIVAAKGTARPAVGRRASARQVCAWISRGCEGSGVRRWGFVRRGARGARARTSRHELAQLVRYAIGPDGDDL